MLKILPQQNPPIDKLQKHPTTTLLLQQEATRSRALWYSLLKIASKPIPPSTVDLRVYYLSNPAVPHDHKTITKAIERTKERGEGEITTVFLEGGRIYYEDLNVQEGEKVKVRRVEGGGNEGRGGVRGEGA